MGKCTAKSKRSKKQCQKWAVRGRSTCHMHGGKSKGPVTKMGKEQSRQAALRHGGYTKESLSVRKEAASLIQYSKNILNFFGG